MRKPRRRAKLTRDERAVLRAFAKSVKASVKGIVATSRSVRKVVEAEAIVEGRIGESGRLDGDRGGRPVLRTKPRSL